MIRTHYDAEVDIFSVRFAPEGTPSIEGEEVAPGIVHHFDAAGNVIAIDIDRAAARSQGGVLKRAGTPAVEPAGS